MSKHIIPYLSLGGRCREAMTFYQQVLGGELELMPFAGSPMEVPVEVQNQIMHSSLSHEGRPILMASDGQPGQPIVAGNTVSLSLNYHDEQEMEQQFVALAAGGKITMPLQDTFWGARFGMLTDQFGILWMFNLDH